MAVDLLLSPGAALDAVQIPVAARAVAIATALAWVTSVDAAAATVAACSVNAILACSAAVVAWWSVSSY